MRELDECRAEVFRRSENRRKERKKRRNRVIAWCIPLCLLIGLWSMSSDPPSNGSNYDGVIGATLGGDKGQVNNAPESAEDSFGINGSASDGIYDSIGAIPNKPGSAPMVTVENFSLSGGTNMNKACMSLIIVSLLLVCAMAVNLTGCSADRAGDYKGETGNSGDFGTVDSFSFSLTWGCYGISSYDSETGKLVKTTDATNPEDYITTYQLTDTQKQQIYDLVKGLDVTAYPDTYNPQPEGFMSSPSMTLILSVNTGMVQKTIAAKGIVYTFESEKSKGQKFLDVCKVIRDILMETDEWKALPEYEFFYD
jgi:hypothetical protein